VTFKALKGGQIDAYPEYSGTALTSFYKVKVPDVPRSKTESFALLKKDLAKDNITPLPQTPFENRYVVVSTKATAAKYGNAKTLSQVAAKAGSSASISGFPECRQRIDCLLGLKTFYHWTPKFVSSQGQYSDLDQKQSDFTFGFTTDGPLSLGKYYEYADDKHYQPPYFVSVLVRNSALSKLGSSGQKVILDVQKQLTKPTMQELNARVTIEKQKPDKVAPESLREGGYIK